MRKRVIVCFLIISLCVVHISTPNLALGQNTSLAEQVFAKYRNVLERNDVKAVLPDVLKGLKAPEVQELLTPFTISLAVGNPDLLTNVVPNIDPAFVTLLRQDQEIKNFLSDPLVQRLLQNTNAIDDLIDLVSDDAVDPFVTPPVVTPPVTRPPDSTVPPAPIAPVAGARDIMISEIMVDTNGGQLPQWIELTNVSSRTVSLNGWSVNINNSNLQASNTPLDGVQLRAGHVMLLVSSTGRQSFRSLSADRVVNAGRKLMSEVSFLISLLPPSGTGDRAGNLGNGWTLPMRGSGRQSLERTLWYPSMWNDLSPLSLDTTGPGTSQASWSLTWPNFSLYISTYYGSSNDIGTPGWHGWGSELPVELSLFSAERDTATGAVEVRWETQSELNNAGFYIKRSETQVGEFSVINAAMIPGAGTTSEKQSYRYTDTTAKPNVVYYYQIEDVSLAGERQTLTQPQRLKGHIGAAGKATVMWGALKSRE